MIHLSALSAARPEQPTVLTVGAFDGVHLGHQALIRDMSAYARANGMRSAVLTFYPHPSVVLNGRRPSFYIYRPAEKLSVFETLGLDLAITEPFSLALSKVSATDFVAQLQRAHLAGGLQGQRMVVQGLGNVGYHAAKFLSEEDGVRVIAKIGRAHV